MRRERKTFFDRKKYFEENPLGATVFWFVILYFLTNWMSQLWYFKYPEVYNRDLIMQVASPSVPARYVRVVSIDKQDLNRYFSGTINESDLAGAIQRILKYNPAVLAIDFDTSGSHFRSLRTLSDPRLVWARGAVAEDVDGQVRMLPDPVLGDELDPAANWGLALFPMNRDWAVRTYQRSFRVGSRLQPSFYWETASEYCRSANGRTQDHCPQVVAADKAMQSGGTTASDLTVDVNHSRYDIHTIQLRDLMPEDSSQDHDPVPEQNVLSGKVVVLGGSYTPQDKHATIFGVVDGENLIATAIESELNPQASKAVGFFTGLGINVFLTILISFYYYRYYPGWALLFSLATIALLFFLGPILCVMVSYRTSSVSFALGILIEQLTRGADSSTKMHKLKEDNMALAKEIEDLKQAARAIN
jgi:CHASE2 domain-containing sensor protein